MTKLCVKEFTKDTLMFIPGSEYKVTYNNIDGRLYIYTVWGYTDISTSQLNSHFV